MDGPLSPEARARGRRLAITSHPVGMIHRVAYSDQLPTLALVALGAGEALVGLQRAVVFLAVLAQLPTLRFVARLGKRRILVAGQAAAVLASLPLAAFGWLSELGDTAPAVALAAFTGTSVAFAVTGGVWFPLLHGYIEPGRTGRFFGTLRTVWHAVLLVYLVGANRWLAEREGDFGPLFAVALGLGIVRIAIVSRLPERREGAAETQSVRAALRFAWRREGFPSYLLGSVLGIGCRSAFATFAIVLMRRELGFSESQVLATTLAVFGGGLVSLVLWGRVVDAIGPEPVFRWTALGQAVGMLAFLSLGGAGPDEVALAVGLFFWIWVLASGFDVADTRVLFSLAPEDSPARLLVPARVVANLLVGVLPLVAGLAIDRGLGAGVAPATAYRGLFLTLAAVEVAAIVPLRRFREPR